MIRWLIRAIERDMQRREDAMRCAMLESDPVRRAELLKRARHEPRWIRALMWASLRLDRASR